MTHEFRGLVSVRCGRDGDEDDYDVVYIDSADVVAVLSDLRFHQGRIRVVFDDVEIAHGDLEVGMGYQDEDSFSVDDTDIRERLRDCVGLYVHLIVSDDVQSPADRNFDPLLP
jgi:hypothetical protein